MSDIYLEAVRALVVLGILAILLRWRSRGKLFRHSGFRLILAGFALIAFATLLDITDNFPSLGRFVILGDTPYQAILEKWVGYLGGFVLLLLGLLKLLPVIEDLSSAKDQIRKSDAMYQALFESASEAIVLKRGNRFINANSKTLEMFGCRTKEELNGNEAGKFSPDSQPDGQISEKEAEEKLNAAYSGKPQYFEWQHRRLDGTPFDAEVSLNVIDIDGDQILQAIIRDVTQRKRMEQAIQRIAKGMSSPTGERILDELVSNLARFFRADYVFIGVLDENDPGRVNTLSVCTMGEIVENDSYLLKDTPSAGVIGQQGTFFSSAVQQEYPKDQWLVNLGIESYIATPLLGHNGKRIGLIAVLDSKALELDAHAGFVMEIFASRASAEIKRLTAERHLRDAQEKLSLHIQQTPLGVIEWNTDFEVVDWNPAAEAIFGYTREEALGRHAVELVVSTRLAPHVDTIWQALLKSEGGTRSSNENRTKDGRTIICEWNNTPLVAEDGEIIGVASLVQDITAQVQMQTELEEHKDNLEETVLLRTRDLEAANKELEAFSYSVSHDLRAPLRAIDGFSEALLEDYEQVLDDTGKSYLHRVRRGAQHMSRLIDDLLMLSRVTRRDMNMVTVDLSVLVKDAARALTEQEPGRQVEFNIQEGVTAQGDQQLLRVLLDNLVGNAWKYTGRKEKAVITFGGKVLNGELVYYLRDNGAGFDMRYADKLFDPFQRLHKSSDFPGTGVGLATVQRIANRHQGRAWAEGVVGEGAVFYFTVQEGTE